MTNTRERLQALQVEADSEHTDFEKRRRKRTARSKALNVAVAILALATGAASGAGMPAAAVIVLASALLTAIGMNLALTDTEHDREVHLLSHAWKRHRTDAARLLAQLATDRSTSAAERIEEATGELESRVAETRWQTPTTYSRNRQPRNPGTDG